MGEWINLLMFPLPEDGAWRRKGSAAFLPPFLQHRRPSVVRWARAAFEQGVLGCLAAFETMQCAVVELPGDRFLQATSASDAAHAQPLMVHAHAGKDALSQLAAIPCWQTLEQGLLGTSLPPSWMGEVWKVSAGLRITFGDRITRQGRAAILPEMALERWVPQFTAGPLLPTVGAWRGEPPASRVSSLRSTSIDAPIATPPIDMDMSLPLEVHCGGLGGGTLGGAEEGCIPDIVVSTGGVGQPYGPGEQRVDRPTGRGLHCSPATSAYSNDLTMITAASEASEFWEFVKGVVNPMGSAAELHDFPPLVAHWGVPRRWWIAAHYLLFGWLRRPCWWELRVVLEGPRVLDSSPGLAPLLVSAPIDSKRELAACCTGGSTRR